MTSNTKIVQIKKTFVPGRKPNTNDQANSSFIKIGELAANLHDKKLFTSDGSSQPIELGSNVEILTVGAINASNSIGVNGQVLYSTGSGVIWGSATNGFVGSQGDRGPIGYSGSQGVQGVVGFIGSQGVIGFTGSQGVIGFTGSQGTTGFVALAFA